MSNEKALNEYIKKLGQCQEEVKRILAVMDNHLDHLEVAPDDVNWAHAGSVGRLLYDLRNISAYLVTG